MLSSDIFFLLPACTFGAAITWLKRSWPGHESRLQPREHPAVSALDADHLSAQTACASILLSPTGMEFAVCLVCCVGGREGARGVWRLWKPLCRWGWEARVSLPQRDYVEVFPSVRCKGRN